MNYICYTKLLLKNKAIIFLFLLGTVVLNSCTTDFELNEPYKEEQIIYGLMGYQDSLWVIGQRLDSAIKDSVQYIKIGKAFQNTSKSALEVAKNPDSLYYGTELEARIEEVRNSTITSFTLLRVTNIPKNSGVFAYPGQVLYRTPQGFKLRKGAVYNIKVKNTKTGKESTATTTLLGKTGLGKGLLYSSDLGFGAGNFPYDWSTASQAKFYDVSLNIYVKEWNINKNTDTTYKKLVLSLVTNEATSNLNGGETIAKSLVGEDLFQFLAKSLKEDIALRRKMSGVEFVFDAGGEEIYNYIAVNTPSLGIVQKVPEYTNIKNGFGIFSAKSTTRVYKGIKPVTIDNLNASETTKRLNFVK